MTQSPTVRMFFVRVNLLLAVCAFALASFLIMPGNVLAAATVNAASGGTNISIDQTSAGGSGQFKTLTGPSFGTENGDIAVGTHTIYLPTGWEFDTTSSITIAAFNDIEFVSTSITPGTASFSFTVTKASTVAGSIGFLGLRVRPTGITPSTRNMTYSGAGITGVDGSTNFGTLSTVAGTVAKLAFSQQPGGVVYGSSLDPQPVVQTEDQFGNLSSSGASGKTVTLSLAPDTGTLLGTATLDISSGTATFTDLAIDMIGTKQLTATAAGLASADSSTFEITAKQLTISGLSATSRPYDGTTDAEITGIPSLVGVEVGDDVSLAGTANGPFDSPNVGSRTVAISGLSLAGADSGNYTLTEPTLDSSITAKVITVTPDSGQTKVYGETDPTFTYTNTALVGSDSISGVLGRDANENVGSYAYTLGTLTTGGNYSLTLDPAADQFAITQRPITVTAIGIDKEYDGTADATVTLSSDKISEDDVTPTYTSASFSDKTAANGKTVTVSGIGISGAKAGNYALQNTTTLTSAGISKRPLTLTINVNNKTYDGSTSATYSGTNPRVLNGVIPGDTVVAESTGSKAFASKNVGIGTVNVSGVTLSGTDKDNYAFDGNGTGTATINARPITVTAITGTKTYDGTVVSAGTPLITNTDGLTSGPIMGSDIANFTQAYDDKNVGTGKTLTPTGFVDDGNSGNNYDIAFVPVTTGEITPATITATVTVANKVVDGSDSATITGVEFGGVVEGDTLTPDFSGATAAFADAAVGNDKAVTASSIAIASGNELGNYSYNGNAAGTGNILPVPTTVYVNGAWTGTETWTDPDGTGPATYFGYDAFATIQDAIGAVAPNGAVNVVAGTYDERLAIDKKITLTGAGIGQTIVQPTFTPTGGTHADKADVWLSDSAASGTTIQDISFDFNGTDGTRPGWGILIGENIATYPGLNVTDVTIQNNDIQIGLGAGGNGIGQGLGITTGLSGDSSGLVITGNAFHGDPTYTGNGSDHGSEAVYINPNSGTGTITISNNTFDGNLFAGISVESGNVTVSGNTIERAAGADVSSTHGIRVNDSFGGKTYSGITITGNTVSGFENGLRLGSGSSGGSTLTVSVSDNTITDNARGIWARNDAVVTAHENTITGNTTEAELLAGSNGSFDATDNYWGTAVAATITGKISGSVDYDPYYVDAGKTILNNAVPSAVYVDGNYSDGSSGSYYFGYNAFNTIQDGIGAVDTGGTINVAAGTYAENLTVGKSVSIEGAGQASTKVGGTHVITASNVSISGIGFSMGGSGTTLTLDSSASALSGISITASSFDLSTSPSIGVYIGGGTPTNTVSSITMNSNTFSGPNDKVCNPWKIGGSFGSPLNASAANLTFDGNTVDRCSIPLNLQNGNLTNIVISNNEFTNTDGVLYVWGEGSPSGVLSGFEFTGNAVNSTNAYGVGIDLSGATVFSDANFGTGNKVQNNVFDNVPGAYGFGAVSLLSTLVSYELNASGNWWGQSTGPAAGAVVGEVSYRPWCTTESCSPLDTTAPVVAVDSLLTNDTTPTVTGTVNEDSAVTVVVTVNGNPYPATVTGGTWSADVADALVEGVYDVSAVAEDSAGNQSSDATTDELNIDLTPPTATISGEPSGTVNTTTASVTVGGADVIVYKYDVDSGGYSSETPVATAIELSGLLDGSHTLSVIGKDTAGNWQIATTTASWNVDATPPSAPSVTLLDPINAGNETAISITGSGEAGASIAYSISDGVDSVTGTGTVGEDGAISIAGINVSALADGTLTVSVTLTDSADNESIAGTDTATKDTVAPVMQSHTPVTNGLNIDPSANITVTFGEPVDANSGTITVATGGVSDAISTSSSGNMLTIHPTSSLSSNSTYTVTISNLTDTAGNPIASGISWSFTTATSYSISLTANAGGWNLVSLPINPTNTAIADVLGDASSAIDAVWTYDPDNIYADASGWLVYHPSTPDDVNISSLRTMETGYGYWVSATSNATLTGSGSLLSARQVPPSRTLSSGWNLIGYYQIPGEESSTMSNAFNSIGLAGTDYTSLWGFDNAAGSFTSVSTIYPGDAFWISVPASGKVYTPSNLTTL